MFAQPGAGLTRPAHVEGRSLVPLLRDPTVAWDHPTLSTYGYGNHAVVAPDFKYIRYADGGEELYDVRRDPNEWSNLAADPAYADTRARLAEYMPATDTPDLWQPPARRGAAGE